MIWKSSILIEYLLCSHGWSNNSTCVRRIMLCQSRGLKRWTRFLLIWRSGGWKPSHPQIMVVVYNSMGVAVVDVRECPGLEAVLATNAMLLQRIWFIFLYYELNGGAYGSWFFFSSIYPVSGGWFSPECPNLKASVSSFFLLNVLLPLSSTFWIWDYLYSSWCSIWAMYRSSLSITVWFAWIAHVKHMLL